DPAAAHRALTRLVQLWETLARENPSVEAFRNDAAAMLNMLAVLEGGRGAAGESAAFTRAVAYDERAVAIWDQLGRAHPEVSAHQENLARVYGELKWLYERSGSAGLALKAYARSAALRKQLIANFPALPANRASDARLQTGDIWDLA